jgi:hypothetical protein
MDLDPTPPLPTHAQLHRASLLAAGVVAVVLVVAVLPAELGVDPTGLGGVLGLTALSAHGPEPHGETPEPALTDGAPRTDELALPLAPGQGAEIKAVMQEGDSFTYTWTSDGGPVFFELHGEPKGAAPDVFTSYEKGTERRAEGTLKAPFEGTHGWYWHNGSAESLVIHLHTRGTYRHIARVP